MSGLGARVALVAASLAAGALGWFAAQQLGSDETPATARAAIDFFDCAVTSDATIALAIGQVHAGDTVWLIGTTDDRWAVIRNPDQPDRPAWLPLAARALALVVRSKTGAALLPALRTDVLALDKDLPVHTIKTMTQILSEPLAQRRIALGLTLAFAAAALLLAAVGLYGVLAQSVALRTHEIGIRLALGATAKDVAGLVVGQGLRLVLVGVAAGLGLSLALSSLVGSLLVGVTAFDPLTFASAALLLLAVALLASLLPIRRANRVDPMTALRCE